MLLESKRCTFPYTGHINVKDNSLCCLPADQGEVKFLSAANFTVNRTTIYFRGREKNTRIFLVALASVPVLTLIREGPVIHRLGVSSFIVSTLILYH